MVNALLKTLITRDVIMEIFVCTLCIARAAIVTNQGDAGPETLPQVILEAGM
jgi:hypothetical protein